MTIIGPGDSDVDLSSQQHSGASRFRPTMRTLVVLAWIGFVAFSLESFSIGDTIFGVLAPAIGLVLGGLEGLGLGYGIVAEIVSGPIVLPALSAALLGAVAGVLSAWFERAYSIKRNHFRKSFISALFSSEIWDGNVAGFFGRLVVSTAIGIALAAVLASAGVFDPTTAIGESWRVVLAGGSGGPWDSGFDSMLLMLFIMLGALLIACGIAGSCLGGLLGSAIGAGFSKIGVSAFIGGASEGLAFRFFAHYRPKKMESGRLIYFLAGAGIGAGDGVVVGFGTGTILFLAQAAHNMG